MLWISGWMQVQRRGTEQMKPLDLMVVKQEKGDEIERRRKSGIVDECVDVQNFRGMLQSDVL